MPNDRYKQKIQQRSLREKNLLKPSKRVKDTAAAKIKTEVITLIGKK